MALSAAVAIAVAAAGCGGGGGQTTAQVQTQHVLGAGYRFDAPTDWEASHAGPGATVRPGSGPSLVSVAVLALRRRYRPALFAREAVALDGVTAALASRLSGKVVGRRTLVVGGVRSRQYDVAYARAGTSLVDRITYVLRGKTEYYLLCRWPAGETPPQACSLLTRTFRAR